MYTVIMIYSPYLWYPKTFETPTKNDLTVLGLGKGLLEDVED